MGTSTLGFTIDADATGIDEVATITGDTDGYGLAAEAGTTLDLVFAGTASVGDRFLLMSNLNTDILPEFQTVTVSGSLSASDIQLVYTSEIAGDATGMVEAVVVPEPATMSLLTLGGIAMLRRRKK